MAANVRGRISACLAGLSAICLGTRRTAAAQQGLQRLVRHVALHDAGRCARHAHPDGPYRAGRSNARAHREEPVVRPGHLRQELRDHDSHARRTAQQLPAHRRQALAGARRRPGQAPAARVQLADGNAVRLRQPQDWRGPRRGDQSRRGRHAAAGVRHAEQADRQAGVLRQGQARARRGVQPALGHRAGRRQHQRRDRQVDRHRLAHQRRHRFLLRVPVQGVALCSATKTACACGR